MDKIKSEESKKTLLVKFINILKANKSELVLLMLAFVNTNFEKFDVEMLTKQFLSELNEFLDKSADEDSKIYDLIFHITEKAYQAENPDSEVS